ncbi:proteasome assembly chaperone family protein [Halolamina litorea]|uniref:Proteasome assembly chaperone family protein n=1 Tax=Halolamina litorea TaxID=1515593 RepID=A0ABD6BPG1_9EURY|nr:PAC2 family protein [Halolamina litorea]
MARIRVVDEGVDLHNPTLVEGFPGAGLVGKIVADHMVDAMDLTHYANVHSDSFDQVAVYDRGTPELASPVRLYADDRGEVLVLQSDIPVEADAAEEFAAAFAPWLEDNATPVFIAGLPTKQRSSTPELFGVGSGAGVDTVGDAGLARPPERGVVSGPAGSLLGHAVENGLDAVGLIVECDPRFPDPVAAKTLLERGIEPIIGRDVSVGMLESQAEKIQQAKERLARRMQDGGDASSEATPLRMFQ